ncbi:TAT-variant-translocated molybdopterin oxidoreductase [Verrucomicrobiota bacterium sgz303538]
MSKRVFNHPPESATGKKYWRSLGQLADTSEFRGWLEREFPQGASEFNGGDVSRRSFLQLMGASAALAGLSLSACRRPEKHLVPFTKGVEWSIPGKALFFATSMPTKRGAAPLVVTTYDGRPVKIEGNPMHPAVKGRSDTWSQSSVLDLYDPDRSRDFIEGGSKSDAARFEKGLDALIPKLATGEGLAFLVEKSVSPTRERLRAEIEKKYPQAQWCVYEPTDHDFARQASYAAFGEGMTAQPQLEKADVILALDSDFLSCTESTVESIRRFTSRRNVKGADSKMNRLYVVENRYTVTGGIADHRLRVPVSQIGAFAAALAAQIGKATNDAALNGLVNSLGANAAKFVPNWVEECAADLVANKGKSLVLVGERQPVAVQQLVHSINAALGAIGTTLVGRRTADKPARTIVQLAKDIADQKIKTLFILGGNPVYNAPADLDWLKLQTSVPTVVRLGFYEDETSVDADGKNRVTWHVPMAHYLEAWGDGIATDGSYTAVQPMILPLYGGWSELDLLAKLAGRPKPAGPELIQETFKQFAGNPTNPNIAWNKFLHDGFLENTAAKAEQIAFKQGAGGQAPGQPALFPPLGENEFEVVLIADSKVDDGRFSNNGWLQEVPDPITKLTWDNAAWISPTTAKKLGVETGDLVDVTVDKQTIRIPVLEAPGHADNSLTIPLGYGREVVGRVGKGTGFNAYPLVTSTQPYIRTGASVRAAGGKYALAITQEHGTLEGRGADLTRQANLPEWKANEQNPEFFKKMGMDAHIPKNVSLYSHPPLNTPESLDPHAWGMTIDLNTCIGCSACMIACQAENNVPIVGKRQVIDGREMHWLRMDRYFASEGGDINDPEIVSQPMLCQHCENAPCETVCPVNATVHSEDGINVMAYNRCIGTRYCANNCPYKVRRFNFFDYNQRPLDSLRKWNLINEKGTPDTIKMRNNPNVTVRMRGVMEKCTFCVQRIQEAKITAKVHAGQNDVKPRVPADAFTVACAQACPTDSIVFGDINNPESTVSKIRQDQRGYRLLEYLNTSTRVWYLARIKNPNPKMPGADKIGAFMKSDHGHAEPKTGAATPEGAHA